MSAYLEKKRKLSAPGLSAMKAKGEKISMVTAYDYTMASIVNESPIDIVLVGDSASNVMLGYSTTLSITLDEMIYMARSAVRGAHDKMVVCDMPFGSYHASVSEAVNNAVRVIRETGCDALKLEGGSEIIPTIRAIINTGIPVMGHLGLTPQSVNVFGGYALRAQAPEEARRLLDDARSLAEAGCFGLVLEKIPAMLAEKVTAEAGLPTIGIGGGNGTDGQVLVLQDLLGMNKGFAPKFLRRYADLHTSIKEALTQYDSDVKSGDFPNGKEQY